jgi:hypothetical protein
MSEKLADAQKKLELSTSIVVAYINASKNAEKSDKSADKTAKSEKDSAALPISDKQILDLLEKTFQKMNELVPLAERRIGLSN